MTEHSPQSLALSEPTRPLIGLSRDELRLALEEFGLPTAQCAMRTRQLWHWIYHRGVTDFQQMSSVSKVLRSQLAEGFILDRPEIAEKQVSEDGTRKYLIRLADQNLVEAVYIPEETRGTLCISSQIGCTLNCTFCHTGTQRLVRNLTAGEIVHQVMLARDDLGEWPSPTENRQISNIVLMGMGEPLYNFENVKQAMQIVMDGEGIAISRRRITLSTSGIVPEIERCGEEIGVNLAISLHATRNDVRDILVPINRKYPIAQLLEACRTYPALRNNRRITFEYVMLDGINDSPAEAIELVKLIKGIPAKVNLIPFNPWPGSPYTCSSWERIEEFADIVNRAGYASPVRTPRGRDIMAACGQLKSASERKPKRLRVADAATASTAV